MSCLHKFFVGVNWYASSDVLTLASAVRGADTPDALNALFEGVRFSDAARASEPGSCNTGPQGDDLCRDCRWSRS